jgi:hypothetical protein
MRRRSIKQWLALLSTGFLQIPNPIFASWSRKAPFANAGFDGHSSAIGSGRAAIAL